jgi:hypothetical protein
MLGCRTANAPVPETPMPPNTVLLAQMMRDLSARPGFTEAFLARLDQGEKKGPAFLTPKLVDRLRELILGKDWQGLDRFPGWTMLEINPTVTVAGKLAGNSPAGSAAPAETEARLKQYIDLGTYSLEHRTISLDDPSPLPGFSSAGIVSDLGDGVVSGDDANPERAPLHAESQRLADVLNRLAINDLASATATVTISGASSHPQIQTPEDLIRGLIASGHSVSVSDTRYFANFGHFHYRGNDVMMPFWVNVQMLVPGTHRPLLIPVSHAEYEWTIRGPKINADISWYFAIDGKAQFRTMDTLDQAWVLGRRAHEYRDADAIEVTRLAGRMTIAYIHQHLARPTLPFGGYYALGVCQDSVAAIEKKMTGTATLFPNTVDATLFDDPRDAEVNALMAAIPNDRAGRPPGPERIFGSLPTSDLASITIPGLAADLIATRKAWQSGRLRRTDGWHGLWLRSLLAFTAALLALGSIATLWKKRRSAQP